MATYGKIEDFVREYSWEPYIERLNFYFEANGITSSDEDLKKTPSNLVKFSGKEDLQANARPSGTRKTGRKIF